MTSKTYEVEFLLERGWRKTRKVDDRGCGLPGIFRDPTPLVLFWGLGLKRIDAPVSSDSEKTLPCSDLES